MTLEIDDFMYRHFPEAKLVGNDYHVNCPFCTERLQSTDIKGHLNVSVVKHVAHCYRCDYAGSWIKLVMDITGLPYYAAMSELYSVPKLAKFKDVSDLLTVTKVHKAVKLSHLPEDFHRLYQDDSFEAAPYVKYMRRRGIKEAMWDKHDLGYAASITLRVIIPIEKGYWQARTITHWMAPKYLNPVVPARELIFNAEAMQQYDEVVICEGAISAMAVGHNAMALISKEATKERLERILASDVSTFVIALEPQAYGSMGKLMDALYRNGRRVIVWNYSRGDPADKQGTFIEMLYSTKTKLQLMMQ
jgi:hypothetical protein